MAEATPSGEVLPGGGDAELEQDQQPWAAAAARADSSLARDLQQQGSNISNTHSNNWACSSIKAEAAAATEEPAKASVSAAPPPGLLDVVLTGSSLDQGAQDSLCALLRRDGSLGALRQAARAGRDWADGNVTQLNLRLRGSDLGAQPGEQQQQQQQASVQEPIQEQQQERQQQERQQQHQPAQRLGGSGRWLTRLQRLVCCARLGPTEELGGQEAEEQHPAGQQQRQQPEQQQPQEQQQRALAPRSCGSSVRPPAALVARCLRCVCVTATVDRAWLAEVAARGASGGGGGGGGQGAYVGAALVAALGLRPFPSAGAASRIATFELRLPTGERLQQRQQQQQDEEGELLPPPVLSPRLPHGLALAFPRLTHVALAGSWRLPPPAHRYQRAFFAGLARLPHLTSLRLDAWGGLQHVRLLAEGCPGLRELSLGEPRRALPPDLIGPDDPITHDVAAALASLPELRLLRLWLNFYTPCLSTLLGRGLAPNLERLKCFGITTDCPGYKLTAAASAAGPGHGGTSSSVGGGSGGSPMWSLELDGSMASVELFATHTFQSSICIRSLHVGYLRTEHPDLDPRPLPRLWQGLELGTWREESPIRRLLRSCPSKSLGSVLMSEETGAQFAAALNLVVPLLGPPFDVINAWMSQGSQLRAGLVSLTPRVVTSICRLGLYGAPAATPESAVATLELLPALQLLMILVCPNLSTEAHVRDLAGRLAAAPEAVRSRDIHIVLMRVLCEHRQHQQAEAATADGGAAPEGGDGVVGAVQRAREVEAELNAQLRAEGSRCSLTVGV